MTHRQLARPAEGATAPSIPPPGGRLRRLLLGPPLPSHLEREERLSNPMALAILSSDALSSVAYATEEMLRVLIPAVGVAAFGLSLPIGGAIIGLLLLLVFSYRQTIKAYPSAGGAYIVTRDNFHALHVRIDEESTQAVLEQWDRSGPDLPLEVMEAPYREPGGPVCAEIELLRQQGCRLVTVVAPSLLLRWWQRPLYEDRSRALRGALAGTGDTALVECRMALRTDSS